MAAMTPREHYLNDVAIELGKPLPFPPPIKTEHVYPPIPTRNNDWCAYYDGHEHGPQGWGATEAEAIADLKENYEEPA